MSKKLVRELHIDANASLGGGSGSSSLKRKRRSVKMDDDGGGGERKGGEEQQEEEGILEAKEEGGKEEGGKEASSLPLTPPSSHNTTSPRPTADLSHSPHGEFKRAVDDVGESHVAQSVETKKEGNAILDEIAPSSEASNITREEVNDLPSHKQGRKITDFFRKTPKATAKASTSSTTTTTMPSKRANLPPDKDKDKDKLLIKLAKATSHMEEMGSKPSSVSSGEVHQAPPAAKIDEGAKKQSRKDSVSSSSSAPAAPQMNTAPSHAKITGSTSTSRTTTSLSLRDKSNVPASQQPTDMGLELTPAPTTQATRATKTRRASGASASSSATSSHGTDDHHHTSESASDTEHDNQKSNPAPTTRTRRASRLSNRFIDTETAKPVTHTARRKSNAEDESSESDESDVDDQGTSRKRTPGIVCADTMIKNWKRYGYESAKDARIQVGHILAKDEPQHSSQDRDASEPQEADGVEQPRVRRQAKKGTVRVETMIKNWGRYHFASAAEARAASAGLSQDTELGVDEIAERLRKYRTGSHIEQVDDTQPDDLSNDEVEEPSLDASSPIIDSGAPITAVDVPALETNPSQSHDDITDTVTDSKAAKVLKQLQMDVSPGIFGSPSDATGRRSRERKRKNMGNDADANAEVLPVTPSAAAMAPPSAKRVKIASPLTLGDASTQKATPKPAHSLTSDPVTAEKVTPALAESATPDAKLPVNKTISFNLPNSSPLRNNSTTSPQVVVPSFTPINQHDKKTAKRQKELDRLRMDVAPGIFASKSASPRSTRGERKRDALIDLDLPIAPTTNPSINDKKSDQDQDKKNQDRKDKDKDGQKQTKSLKRTNSSSLILPETSPRAIAPPAKKLKLTFGPKSRGLIAVSAPTSASIAMPTTFPGTTSSQKQTERQVSPLHSAIIGNGPTPRFIRAESTTPSAIAVDCEHVEKGWIVINPVYVNSLYDYLNILDTGMDEEEEHDEGVQAKDRQGEEHDEEENARQSDSLTTEQEKAKQSPEKEWEKDEADLAEINERMLEEFEMIMTWSVMTDAEKKAAGIAG